MEQPTAHPRRWNTPFISTRDAPNVTEDGDDNATTSLQVIVPASISSTTSIPTVEIPADERLTLN
jgi:hypothetical protein